MPLQDHRSNLNDLQKLQRIAVVVPTLLGIVGGIGLFIWGPLFYDSLSATSSPETAITVTSVLLAFSYILGFFLEVPTGALGDAMGRKWTVVVSFYCKMLQMIFLGIVPFCNNTALIITAGVLSTIFFQAAYAFYSGTFVAWCVDTLRDIDSTHGYETILTPAARYRSAGMALGGIIAIVCFYFEITFIAFVIGAMICCFCALYCTVEMQENTNVARPEGQDMGVSTITARMGQIIGDAFSVFRNTPAILAAVGIYATMIALVNITEYFWPLYVRTKMSGSDQLMLWIGMIIIDKYSAAIGSQLFGHVTNRIHRKTKKKLNNKTLRKIMVSTGICTVFPVLFVSYKTSDLSSSFVWCAIVVGIIGLTHGVVMPCFETFVNNNITDSHSGERATILSFASLLRGLFVTLLAVPTWSVSGAESTRGWIFPAIALLIATIIGNRVMKRGESKAPDILAEGSLIEPTRR